jgi:excisionase family DNA binding protein
MDPEDVMTPYQVSELLHMHPDTIYSMIRRNEIRAVKVGSHLRILRRDVEAMLAGESV